MKEQRAAYALVTPLLRRQDILGVTRYAGESLGRFLVDEGYVPDPVVVEVEGFEGNLLLVVRSGTAQ